MTRLGFYIVHNNRYKLVKMIDIPWDFSTGQPDSDSPIIDRPIIGEWDSMKYVLTPNNVAYEDEYQIVVKDKTELSPTEQKEITKLYRITYNNTGIFNAIRQYMTPEEWEEFLNDENVNWLYKPDVYGDSYISYFTEFGYTQFKEKTFPLILNFLQEENIDTDILEVVREEEDLQNEEEPINPPAQIDFENWITNYFYDILFKEKEFFNVFNTNRTYIIIAEEDSDVMGFMITYKGRTVINFKEHDYKNIINSMFPKIREDMSNTKDETFGGYDEDRDFSQNKNRPDSSFGGYDDDIEFLI